MTRRLPLALAGLATLTALTACGGLFPRGCTEEGAESGVFFDDLVDALPGTTKAGPSTEAGEDPTYRAVACARGVCEEWEGGRSDGPWLQVLLDDLTAPTSVTATLTITDTATGDVVFDASTSTDLVVVQPNGPHCPPTAYQGRVVPTPGGALVQVAMQD